MEYKYMFYGQVSEGAGSDEWWFDTLIQAMQKNDKTRKAGLFASNCILNWETKMFVAERVGDGIWLTIEVPYNLE